MTEQSYGFRPGAQRPRRAAARWDTLLKAGHDWVVDADLKSYFDTIPHEPLLALVKARISDGRILGLLRSWLAQDILRDMQRWTPTDGHAARCGDQPAAGQHLSAPAG